MDEVRPAEAPSSSSRLIERLRGVWRDVAEQFGRARGLEPDLPPDDADLVRAQMRDCLDAHGGEVSSRAHAAVLGRSYLGLNAQGRQRFLHILAEEFGTDSDAVDDAIAAVQAARNPGERLRAEQKLRQSLEAGRVKILSHFNSLPEGVKFLVDLRAELMAHARKDPALAVLESDLRDLLASWFDIGFLELQRITWRTPALVLEKIAAYEAVHAIQSWQDLKNRLDSDRRFFAFFHPRMPDEPLIFVEVALVRGMSARIDELLDEKAPVGDPGRADSAIFYSITSAQRGLAGISFGNFLIKRVADELGREFPNLKTFATLSPIPGFRAWLDGQTAKGNPLSASEQRALAAAGLRDGLAALLAQPWNGNPSWTEVVRAPLLRLCAVYLTSHHDRGGRALDPVAHFHLSNGARLERLNWLADSSERGILQSAGIMANYLYRLDDIEDNHEAYTGRGEIVTSAAIRSLAKG